MSNFIIKIKHEGHTYFAEWGTIVDAPTTRAMTHDDFARYYRDEYGRQGMDDFEERIARARENGCSAIDQRSLTQCVYNNRCGPKDSMLSMQGLVAYMVEGKRGKELEQYVVHYECNHDACSCRWFAFCKASGIDPKTAQTRKV